MQGKETVIGRTESYFVVHVIRKYRKVCKGIIKINDVTGDEAGATAV